MRRHQLSGLEHVHMMRHVPRSYDMTRTHIMHKSVNKHVDVVLRCSPKNWKKKKVTVNVVRGEKKNDAARIAANAKKGYVAVRKTVNDQFEADRKIAAAAFETKYGTRSAGSDALIHDMKSQISTMAQKSADYIDSQLTEKPEYPYGSPMNPTVESKPVVEKEPLISAETEDILKKGGYKLPKSKPEGSPYAADYLMHASNEEFHNLMDSLEKSLDEACKKYAAQPDEPAAKTETETEPTHETESGKTEFGYEGYNGFGGYGGGYNMPGDISLSVTKKQEIKAEENEVKEAKLAIEEEEEQEFKPALTFTDGGEHYIPDSGRHYLREDDLFDRELNRPGDTYVPPANFFEDEEIAPSGDSDDSGEAYVPLPDAIPAHPSMPKPQNIFYTEEDDQPIGQQEGYPREDYVQQQVFFTTQPDDESSSNLYNPPQEEEEFAEPTLYHDMTNAHGHVGEESDYEPPMVFPDNDNDGDAPEVPAPDDDEDLAAPMIFPNNDEDLPPPMIFPDDDEGYSPAPVSPDRNEYYDDGNGDQGVVNRSGQTLFSRTGDQIKKVIGIIHGSGDSNISSKNNSSQIRNHNVEITYTDRDGKNI